MRSILRALGPWWVMSVTVLSASVAHAQASDPELRPTRGPAITDAARAGDADATALELNPGALAFLPAAGLELVGAAASDPAVVPRRGAGAYLGLPIILHSAIGVGLSGVAGASAQGIDAHTVFRLGYALRLGRGLALGASWGHLWGGRFAGSDTFDAGLAARLGRYLALGATVEDANEPRPLVYGGTLPRLWTAEVVARPLGTNRLEIALGAAHANGDAWERIVPRARLSAIITDGLRLYGEAESVPDGAALAFGGGSNTRLGFGLAVDFDHLGGAFGVPILIPGAGTAGAGVEARLHLDGARRPALAAPAYVARVRLQKIGDDRAFFRVVERLRALAVDPAAVGVLLKIEDLGLGYGRIEELRDLVALLRAHGKRTFAYVTSPSMREYYLASSCDMVVMHPAGEVSITGVAQNVTFYKGPMDRLGIHLDLVRIGKFKGAMEPFVMTQQSPDVRDNRNQLLDDVFNRLVSSIAQDRTRAGHPLDASGVRGLIDRGVFSASEATQAGLADAVAAEGDLAALVARSLERPRVAMRDPDRAPTPDAWPGPRVAVLFVEGAITDGPNVDLPFGLGDLAGSETLVAALERCRHDPTVRALVLRVNSPGGSAFASDVVAREVKSLRAAGKPVVVSMGDLAASGGYYIAAPADVIYAEPSTLSGSIGVFGYKVDVQKLLATLGINVESYLRGAHADSMSPFRPWTDAERAVAQQQIRNLYQMFVATVVDGRHRRDLTAARVDELGQGHVWTGALAQSVGLVDRMGGLSTAIDEAARLGGVPVGRDQLPELTLLPRTGHGLLRRLAGATAVLDDDSFAGADADGPPTVTAPVARLLTDDARAALRLLAPFLVGGGGAGYQARLPYDLELR